MPNKPENTKYALYLCAFVFYHAGTDIYCKKTKIKAKRPKTSTRLERSQKPMPKVEEVSEIQSRAKKSKPDQDKNPQKPKKPKSDLTIVKLLQKSQGLNLQNPTTLQGNKSAKFQNLFHL